MSQINAPKQTVNTIIIVAGIGLLLYDFINKPDDVYFKIFGLVILMFGLYKSTQQWTSDNKSNDVAEEDETNLDVTNNDNDENAKNDAN